MMERLRPVNRVDLPRTDTKGASSNMVTESIRRGWQEYYQEWFCLQRNENGVVAVCKQKGLQRGLPGYVVVRITACSVCQADRRVQLGLKECPPIPYVILGHEGVGVVVWTDQRHSHLLGQKIVILPHVYPKNHELYCEAYATGNWHRCRHSQHVGFNIDGTFAEYMLVQVENVQPLPLDVQRDAAKATAKLGLPEDVVLVLIEPLACVKTAIDTLIESLRNFQKDLTVEGSWASKRRALLMGCGVMSGIWAVELRNLGYAIFLNDDNNRRARLLGRQLGIKSRIWVPDQEEADFDLVVVNAAEPSASTEAFKYVKDNGTVYLFSGINKAKECNVRDPIGALILQDVHESGYPYRVTLPDGRIVTVVGSSGYSRKAFWEATRDVGKYASIFTRLITGIVYGLDGRKVYSLVTGVPDFEYSSPALPLVFGDWKETSKHLKIAVIISRNDLDVLTEATVKEPLNHLPRKSARQYSLRLGRFVTFESRN